MDWIAAIFELTAGWIVGNKNKNGYLLFIIGGICWLIYSITSRSAYGLFLVICPAIVINIRNYIKWLKEERDALAVEEGRDRSKCN